MIIRYRSDQDPEGAFGVVRDGVVHRCADSLGDLLRTPMSVMRQTVEAALASKSGTSPGPDVREAPVDASTEVWACGVTYLRSHDARREESATADVYTLVYHADRPELFFKAVGWRVVTDGAPIAIRRDSELSVPEPELGLVVNAHREIVGFLVANDVTARSIEAANPLYLPQAKIYAGACALGSSFVPAWDVAGPNALRIDCTIERDGAPYWQGQTTTAALNRSFAELVDTLFAEEDFPDGVILLTGTGIVPEMEVSLRAGDVVAISIEGVGSLRNAVVSGKSDHRVRSTNTEMEKTHG